MKRFFAANAHSAKRRFNRRWTRYGDRGLPGCAGKIFLDASSEERAHRRMLQLQENGFSVNFERLLAEIKERDDRDRHRAVAPLVPAADALVLDSTRLSIEQVIEKALQYARQKLALA